MLYQLMFGLQVFYSSVSGYADTYTKFTGTVAYNSHLATYYSGVSYDSVKDITPTYTIGVRKGCFA